MSVGFICEIHSVFKQSKTNITLRPINWLWQQWDYWDSFMPVHVYKYYFRNLTLNLPHSPHTARAWTVKTTWSVVCLDAKSQFKFLIPQRPSDASSKPSLQLRQTFCLILFKCSFVSNLQRWPAVITDISDKKRRSQTSRQMRLIRKSEWIPKSSSSVSWICCQDEIPQRARISSCPNQ